MHISRRRGATVILLAVLGLTAVATPWILLALGSALVWEDSLEAVEAIVIPTWARPSAVLDVLDLLTSGTAARVVVIDVPPSASDKTLLGRGFPLETLTAQTARLVTHTGIQPDRIVRLTATVGGTNDEMEMIARWRDQTGIKSVLVLTPADHSRRVNRVLKRTMPANIKTIVRSLRFSQFQPDRWWKSRAGLRVGIVELQKLTLDLLAHPLS